MWFRLKDLYVIPYTAHRLKKHLWIEGSVVCAWRPLFKYTTLPSDFQRCDPSDLVGTVGRLSTGANMNVLTWMKFDEIDCQSMKVTAISGVFPVKYGLFLAPLPHSAQALEPAGICGSNQFGSHCCDALCACSSPVSLSLFISLYSVTSIVSTCFGLAFGMSAINTCVRCLFELYFELCLFSANFQPPARWGFECERQVLWMGQILPPGGLMVQPQTGNRCKQVGCWSHFFRLFPHVSILEFSLGSGRFWFLFDFMRGTMSMYCCFFSPVHSTALQVLLVCKFGE